MHGCFGIIIIVHAMICINEFKYYYLTQLWLIVSDCYDYSMLDDIKCVHCETHVVLNKNVVLYVLCSRLHIILVNNMYGICEIIVF